MVNIDTGFFINTPTATDRTSAAAARRVLGSLLTFDIGTTYTNPKPGVLPGNGATLAVSSASSTALSFYVTRGYAVLVRSSAPQLGAYIAGMSSDIALTLAAANASNPRIDTIYICQPDPEAGDSTHARIDVVQGTAAASPVAPADSALPQGSLRLADILIPAGATAASACTITGRQVYTGLNNTPPVYATEAALPLPAPFGARAVVQNPTNAGVGATNVTYRASGGVWRPWESDWITWNPTFITGWGTTGTSNNVSRYRWVSGRVQLTGWFTVNGSTPTNDITRISLPVTNAVVGDTGANPSRAGQAWGYRNNLGRIALNAVIDGPARFALTYWTATGTGQFQGLLEYGMYTNTPVSWAAGDTFGFDFTFDVY